ncbi:MAG: IS21 family transposase, partial [bacterium]|nr:IS21 family transposase [bacterium]
MTTTDVQVRKLMEEYQKLGQVGTAALRAGMHRNTASKYLKEGRLPSTMGRPRDWRTRPDPFVEDWEEVAARLEDAPELEAKALFDDLLERKPGRYQEGQLRTFQRRVQQWRAQEGPPKEVFFAQEHRPGEAMQTDFTWATELEITIAGEPFVHLLCHSVLPYSNWEWATPCL